MINLFVDEYAFLSNFYPINIFYEGINYPSVEHAFQAAKTDNHEHKIRISKMASLGEAKRFGKIVELKSNWESIKVKIMEELLNIKFQNPDLEELLLSTGNKELVDVNSWNDYFWGVCKGRGKNMLGKLLMKIRDEIKFGNKF